MRRRASDPNGNPGVRPVRQVELSSRRLALRVVGFAVFFLIAVGAITYAIASWVNSGTGWQEIAVSSVAECPESGDFTLVCDLGDKGGEARRKRRALTEVYTEALSRAAALFDVDDPRDGASDLYRLNASVGEEITVDPDFYSALERVLADGRREIFFAPITYYYEVLFSISSNDTLAAAHDPLKSDALSARFAQILPFVRDPDHVSIDLLGENRVRLLVSDEYRTFARENGITAFVDFFRMKNALIVDLTADALIAAGCPDGFLTSYDGFARSIGKADDYEFPLYEIVGGQVIRFASLGGASAKSAVSFRSFPITSYEASFCSYRYRNGELRMGYLDTGDGLLKTATVALTLYAADRTCADLYLSGVRIYAAETTDVASLASLSEQGIRYIRQTENEIFYSDPDLSQTEMRDAERYTVVPVE